MVWTVLACGGVDDRVLLEVPILAGAARESIAPAGVTLTEATITFSDLRLEEPPMAEAAVWRVLDAVNPIAAAYAHPGHDYPGDVAGELLGTFTVDLLADDAELGTALCYSGDYATGRVSVAGATATFAGTYDDVPFRFAVDADQDIVGIPFAVTMDPARPPASVDLRFDWVHALSFTDWDGPDDDADGELTDADAAYGNTALFGVVATPTWALERVEGT